MLIAWNVPLVILSVLVAMIGSFTALTHAERMRSAEGRAVKVWMWVGGATLGLTIWSMHFIGMLAFQLPIPVTYNLFLTLLSILPAIGAALLGFYVLQAPKISPGLIAIASLCMGGGIGAMHYTGMAAVAPEVFHDPSIVVLSLVIAVVASAGALLMMYRGDWLKLPPVIRFSLGGVIMGLAISGMHYTAMVAAHVPADSVSLYGAGQMEVGGLAILVPAISLFWFCGGLLATLFDQRLARQNAASLERLRLAHADLEAHARAMEILTKELQERDKRFQLLLESVAEGIYGVDLEGVCTFVNSSCLNMLGFQRDELVGRYIHSLIHHTRPDGTPYPWEECPMDRASRRNERIHVDDEVFWRKDGTAIPVEYWSHPIVRNGEVVGAVATFFDITERRRAERELKIAATAFEVQEGVVITDADTRIIRVNNAFTQITGYSAEEAVGQTPALLKSGRHDAEFYREMCGSCSRRTPGREKSGTGAKTARCIRSGWRFPPSSEPTAALPTTWARFPTSPTTRKPKPRSTISPSMTL